MAISYRTHDDPNLDPIASIWPSSTEKTVVSASVMTPELIARCYKEMMTRVKVSNLVTKNEKQLYGLESLPKLLRSDECSLGEGPEYFDYWLQLNAGKDFIISSLQEISSYQQQYLVLFPFRIPAWSKMPSVAKSIEGIDCDVLDSISAESLVVSKKQKQYIIKATWSPSKDYFAGKKPCLDEGLYQFNLSALTVVPIQWDDVGLLERIESGQWANFTSCAFGVKMAIECSVKYSKSRLSDLEEALAAVDVASNAIHHGM